MMLFHTRAAGHIAEKMGMPRGKCTIKNFSDGEIYVKIEEDVENKEVWVLASTIAPAENLLELMFLLDALKRGKADISLFVIYFGYARQDRTAKGEAFSSKLVCKWLNEFGLRRIFVLHMHSARLENYLRYRNVIPFSVFYPLLRGYEVIAAPDKGAFELASYLSHKMGVGMVVMEKTRPGHEEVSISRLFGSVAGKRVALVDDMITTGNTIAQAAKTLKEEGAKEISVFATHGVFTNRYMEKIQESPVKEVYVTNSILPGMLPKKVRVVDVAPLVESIIRGLEIRTNGMARSPADRGDIMAKQNMAKQNNESNNEYYEKDEQEADIYEEKDVEEELDEDEIAVREAGFMEGYDRELVEESEDAGQNRKKKSGDER